MKRTSQAAAGASLREPLCCPRCHTPMKIIAVITDPWSGNRTDPAQVLKILRHLIKKGTPPPGLDPASLD